MSAPHPAHAVCAESPAGMRYLAALHAYRTDSRVRSFLLVVLTLIVTTGGTAQPWRRVGTIGHGRQIIDVDFVDASIGYAVDYDGCVYRTSSRGSDWSKVSGGILEGPTTMHFVSDSEGLVSCYKIHPDFTLTFRIYRTSDSGATWALMFEESGDATTGNILWNVAADRERIVYSASDAIYVSTDRGLAWMRRPASVAGMAREDWAGVDIVNSRIWLCGSETKSVIYSDDFGESWSRAALPPAYWSSVAMFDESRICVASGEEVHWTTDNGATWNVTRVSRRQYPTSVIEQVEFIGESAIRLAARGHVFRIELPDRLVDEQLPVGGSADLMACAGDGECWVVDRYSGVVHTNAVPGAVGDESSRGSGGTLCFDAPGERLIVSCLPGAGSVQLVISDLLGRRVGAWAIDGADAVIDVSHLPGGIYVAVSGSESLAFVVR